MLKREHFKQMRHRMNRGEQTFVQILRGAKKQMLHRRQAVYNALRPHTGKVIGVMMLVLVAGVVGAFVRRAQMGSSPEKIAGEQILEQTKKVGSALTDPIASGVKKQLDMLTVETMLSHILQKDSLSREDSLFLLELDAYLNGTAMYQELLQEDSLGQAAQAVQPPKQPKQARP